MWWLLAACASAGRDDSAGTSLAPLPPVQLCARDEAARREAGASFERLEDPAWTGQYAGTPEAPGGEGLVVADLDGDEVLDVLVPSPDGDTRLFMGALEDGRWRPLDETARRLPDLAAHRARAAAAADLDGDTDLDLYLGTDAADVVLRNDGSGVFTALPGTDPSSRDTWRTSGVSFGVDPQDGALIAFVANYVEHAGITTNRLLRWHTPGTTPHATPLEGPLAGGLTFGMLPVDVDDDGVQEVIVLTDKILPIVYRWRDGALVPYEDPELTGRVASVMGAALGDLNRDGRPDFLYPAYRETSAAESSGEGWVDSAAARGFVVDPANGRHVAWGALSADLDNDGALDAVVAYGPHEASGDRDQFGTLLNPLRQPYSVLLADADGILRESAGNLRLADALGGRGSVLADLDRDGWLDLLRRDVLGPPLVDLSVCGDAHWLVVALEDAPPNKHAVGARVTVETASGTRTGWVTAGGPGYASSGPPEVHVGLGDEDVIEGIVVTWPDGTATRHTPVAVNQRVVLGR